jgi:membrane protein YdbS with pleckstrin-like domain
MTKNGRVESRRRIWRIAFGLVVPFVVAAPIFAVAHQFFESRRDARFYIQVATAVLGTALGLLVIAQQCRDRAERVAVGVAYVLVVLGVFVYWGLWTRGTFVF